jgi:hypothetical protein
MLDKKMWQLYKVLNEGRNRHVYIDLKGQ